MLKCGRSHTSHAVSAIVVSLKGSKKIPKLRFVQSVLLALREVSWIAHVPLRHLLVTGLSHWHRLKLQGKNVHFKHSDLQTRSHTECDFIHRGTQTRLARAKISI